jgi:hypothetical protein
LGTARIYDKLHQIMNAFPIQLGVTAQGDIMLAQTAGGQEQVITISPDQVEQLISALRAAVEELQKPR